MNKKEVFRIPIVLGTARKNRLSIHVARFIHTELAKRDGVETKFVDVADFIFPRTVPYWEEHNTAKRWRAIAAESDGFLIVTPEYNRGYPGELKQLLDAAYDEYEKKPVALAGVSSGRFGGTAAVEALKPTLVELGLVAIRGAVRFSNVEELFDGYGALKAPEAYQKPLGKLFDLLIWHTRALKEARDKK